MINLIEKSDEEIYNMGIESFNLSKNKYDVVNKQNIQNNKFINKKFNEIFRYFIFINWTVNFITTVNFNISIRII